MCCCWLASVWAAASDSASLIGQQKVGGLPAFCRPQVRQPSQSLSDKGGSWAWWRQKSPDSVWRGQNEETGGGKQKLSNRSLSRSQKLYVQGGRLLGNNKDSWRDAGSTPLLIWDSTMWDASVSAQQPNLGLSLFGWMNCSRLGVLMDSLHRDSFKEAPAGCWSSKLFVWITGSSSVCSLCMSSTRGKLRPTAEIVSSCQNFSAHRKEKTGKIILVSSSSSLLNQLTDSGVNIKSPPPPPVLRQDKGHSDVSEEPLLLWFL